MTSRFKNSLPVRLLVNVTASPADLQIAMISTMLSLCSGVNLSKPSIKLNVTLGIPVSCIYNVLDLADFTLIMIDLLRQRRALKFRVIMLYHTCSLHGAISEFSENVNSYSLFKLLYCLFAALSLQLEMK